MPRFVSPTAEELKNLRTPLTEGEKLVFEFFDGYLPPAWEIYVQPHLNGLRPDFVLLNPQVGIAVFEVKDWDLDAMEYGVEYKSERAPTLFAKKDGKRFSLQNQNPIEKAYRYREEIRELYCPRMEQRSGLAVITAGVIFPFAQDDKVKELLAPCLQHRPTMNQYPEYNPVSGSELIWAGDIHKVFPESKRTKSFYMSPMLSEDLKNWLIEPDFSSTQRQPLELDKNQEKYVNTRTESGYRRIKGPAGSGKSLVLAARAAQLQSEGKDVLVISYNITLLNYLKDLAVRYRPSGKVRQGITWLHFHSWCKRVCQESDNEEKYFKLWSNTDINSDNKQVLEEQLANLVSSVIDDDSEGLIEKYDAVLVDEGQDLLPSWWEALRKVCRKDGEMLLVADATQDVYGNARDWTDEAMKGAGFSGPWAELKESYRLPPLALQYARDFAEKYLPKDTRDLPTSSQGQLDLFPCKLKWVHISAEEAREACIDEVSSLARYADEHEQFSIPDTTFLVPSEKFGIDVISQLQEKGFNVIHTFGQNSRKKKMAFYMGDARIKATTLHSFKGWESRAIVLYTGHSSDLKSLALIYTGLTRIKRNPKGSFLTVISSSPNLQEYGNTWPKS